VTPKPRPVERWISTALTGPVSPPLAILLACLLLAFAALRYAEPILDGDLFWHFAYALQMIERGTLIPDATLYSWTPASNAIIYCAWAAELLLYGLWSVAGLTGIFALRYAVVAAVLGLLWLLARRLGLARAPVTALALVMLIDLVHPGSLPKPDMFSLLLFAAVVFLYAHARVRAVAGAGALPGLYAVPAIVAIWANVHGGFILLAPFLAATALGEIALFAAGAQARLPRAALLHLLVGWALCAPATALTPYGLDYPVGLVTEYVLGRVPRPDVRWNAAYLTIFDPRVDTGRFLAWLVGMAAVIATLGWLAWRRAGTATMRWLPLGVAVLAYLPLYLLFIRATPYLPVVASFLAVALACESRRGMTTDAAAPDQTWSARVAAWSAAVLALFGMSQVVLKQPHYGWLGFGIGYVNPVQEAEFLARQPIGSSLYNIFDSGGYLLWRLYPNYRVMTDSRSFPYLSWFEDQFAFANGTMFEPFLKKYPADVAIIDLAKQDLWREFLKTRDWQLVFYGPTAAVFTKANRAATLSKPVAAPERFSGVRSVQAAIDVFQFATFVGDYPAANVALRSLETNLRWQTPAAELQKAQAYREAIRAVHRQQWPAALELLERGTFGRPVSDRDRVVLTLLVALVRTPSAIDASTQAQIQESLLRIAPPGFP
jgi:hypothetical protein